MPCYATRRVSIRWPPDEPYEDTDTLVLSVDNHFVDIRVSRDLRTIDWAFSGTKRVEADGRHVWTHELDSRGSLEEDAGYVTVLPNEDELERGSMRNPATDTVMRHEEIWRSVPLSDARGFVARSIDRHIWVATVDRHLLIIGHERGRTSVARHCRDPTDGSWSLDYTIGSSPDLSHVTPALLGVITSSHAWQVLASTGFPIDSV